jgi:WXG100 family type VII secretion target
MRVDPATLYQAASDVDDVQHAIAGTQAAVLRAAIEAETRWRGLGGAGFQDAVNRWSGDVTTVLAALADVGELLRKAADRHAQNDTAQAQRLGRYDATR